LSPGEQLALLGMSPKSGRSLSMYRRGERALPAGRDALDRAGYLIGMHADLRMLFPEDEQLRYGWVRRANAALGGRTPLQVMLEDGHQGLSRMARFLASLCER
jgi:hypothetical protein